MPTIAPLNQPPHLIGEARRHHRVHTRIDPLVKHLPRPIDGDLHRAERIRTLPLFAIKL